jgi:hypothetical protein
VTGPADAHRSLFDELAAAAGRFTAAGQAERDERELGIADASLPPPPTALAEAAEVVLSWLAELEAAGLWLRGLGLVDTPPDATPAQQERPR